MMSLLCYWLRNIAFEKSQKKNLGSLNFAEGSNSNSASKPQVHLTQGNTHSSSHYDSGYGNQGRADGGCLYSGGGRDRARGRGHGTFADVQCQICHKFGHKASHCWYRNDASYSSKPSQPNSQPNFQPNSQANNQSNYPKRNPNSPYHYSPYTFYPYFPFRSGMKILLLTPITNPYEAIIKLLFDVPPVCYTFETSKTKTLPLSVPPVRDEDLFQFPPLTKVYPELRLCYLLWEAGEIERGDVYIVPPVPSSSLMPTALPSMRLCARKSSPPRLHRFPLRLTSFRRHFIFRSFPRCVSLIGISPLSHVDPLSLILPLPPSHIPSLTHTLLPSLSPSLSPSLTHIIDCKPLCRLCSSVNTVISNSSVNVVLNNVLKLCNLRSINKNEKEFCSFCCLGKSHRLPSSPSTTVYDTPFDLVYTDLWGPAPCF